MNGTNRSDRSGSHVAAWWLAIYWPLMIVVTHYPLPPSTTPQHADKLVHVAIFAVLAALVALTVAGLSTTGRGRRQDAIGRVWILGALVAYGLLDEWTQPLTGRQFDWFDWAADCVGVVLGLSIWLGLTWVRGGAPNDKRA